jgi:DNA polymerase sigma
MDIFVDQMGALNQTINRLTSEQRELKESFSMVLDHLSQESKNNQKGFITLASSMNDIARTNQMVQSGLKELYRLQTSNQESVENRERLLLNMINKVEKKDEELKVGIFEMVDAIENMDKNLKAKNTNIERLLRESLKSKKGDTHSKLDEIGEFMRRHLAKEDI